MYIIPVCSKGFATLTRAMKKLDVKCRHHWVPNNLFVQSNAAKLTARIKFGGSHSSDPECPGAHRFAPIYQDNHVLHRP
jgi:hypothetical protein